MNQIPEQYKQYQWIADRFSKVKGVELVMLNSSPYGISLFVTNNKTGDQKKIFEFPLRRMFYIDFNVSGDTPHPYSIMELNNPHAMVELGVAKAEMFFNNSTIQ